MMIVVLFIKNKITQLILITLKNLQFVLFFNKVNIYEKK
jgi:hypothetical protein